MYNRIILVGRVTADPELRKTPNGVSVTSFSLAVNRAYSKGGERQADFFDVVAWRSNAEFISRYFVKGSAILIEGTMESRSFEDKSGQKRRAWEVIAENARFVEGKAERSAQEAIPAQTSALGDFTEIDDDDDLF